MCHVQHQLFYMIAINKGYALVIAGSVQCDKKRAPQGPLGSNSGRSPSGWVLLGPWSPVKLLRI